MSAKDRSSKRAPILFDQLIAGPSVETDREAPFHPSHETSPSGPSEDPVSQGPAHPDRPPSDSDRTSDEEGRGRLAPEARRAVVELMRQGVVMAEHKRRVFEALCRDQKLIEDHLADMYLRMLIDRQAGLAILLQQEADEEDEEEGGSLISRRTLSLYDTLLLLVLRKQYQEREAAGAQRIFVDIDHLEARLTPFLPLTQSTRGDRRRLSGALEKMKERKILHAVRGDDERFEITPVIRYVVNAEFLEHLLKEYRQLAEQAGRPAQEGATDA